MSGTIKKKKIDKPYSMVYNDVLRDRNLSWQAKGLYAYLASNSDDWKIKKSGLVSMSSNGYSATNSAFNELVEKGYIIEDGYDRKDGKFQGVNYVFNEILPNGENHDSVASPNGEKPCSVFPKSENHQLINNKYNKEQSNKYSKLSNDNLVVDLFSKDSINDITNLSDNYIKDHVNNNKGENFEKPEDDLKSRESKARKNIIDYFCLEYWPTYTFVGSRDGRAIKEIIEQSKKYLQHQGGDSSPESVFEFFKVVIQNLPQFYKTKNLAQINSGYSGILKEIQNGKQTGNSKQPSKYSGRAFS